MGLKSAWRQLRSGRAGSRFRQQYEVSQEARSSQWTRPAWIAAGALVVLIGVVGLPFPGPGTLIIAAGGAILARESLLVARMLDRIEVTLRALFHRSKGAASRGAARTSPRSRKRTRG